MPEELGSEDFEKIISARNENILKKLGEKSVLGVTNSDLLAILNKVRSYWKDQYRPALTSFSCEAVGGSKKIGEAAALIFSLAASGLGIHDDIIDNSMKKHFRRTILELHGLKETLLAGDLLIVKGWSSFKDIIDESAAPSKIGQMMGEYERICLEICEGQFNEINCIKNVDLEMEQYEKVLWQSAADIEACTKIGAMLGHGSEAEVTALAEFGRHLGFVKRLEDDVRETLNLEGTLSQRLINERIPLPILFTAKASTDNYNKIKIILSKQEIDSFDIKDLLEECFRAEAFSYIREIAQKNSDEAAAKLNCLKPSFARNVLNHLNSTTLSDLEELCR
jgi:geranylgeranyl pyrophosphate synthase